MSNKDNQPVTRGMLNEAVDAILDGVDRLMRKRIDETKSELRQEIKHVEVTMKDEIDGIKADLSNTATRKDVNDLRQEMNNLREDVNGLRQEMREGFKQTVTHKEFNNLTRKVDRYHPIN